MQSSNSEIRNSTGIRKSLFIDSTPLLDDPAALMKRGKEDGYLFFKRLLPPASVLAVAAEMLGVVERHGWRQPHQGPLGRRINLDALNQVPDTHMRSDIGVSMAAYDDVQKLELFHALPHHPNLISFYERFFGEKVLVQPRHVARMITGHLVMVPTPPHQDFPLFQGSTETWTCWIPLGDCPRTMGGLTILKGSNHNGYLPVQPTRGAGGIAAQLCPWESEWVEGDYEAGDILMFTCHTVHKALRCSDKEMIRLSMDIRYQPASQPVDEKSLVPHCDLSWKDVYRDWKNTELQYYWQKLAPQLASWNEGYLKPSRRIC
jgi:hypothetical protein